MGRGFCVLCCSWIAIGIATVPPVSSAQTYPSTQPRSAIVEVTIEDPLTADSRCYLDLDTGKTYPRGETQADLVASRQFIHDNGIDLMCETREPSRGLVAYDMVLRANTIDITQPPAFVTLRRMFEKAEPTLFDFVTPGDQLPKSYQFRTAGGSMAVLQIVAQTENPSGLRLRYRLVPEPPPPPLPARPVIFGRAVPGQAMAAQWEAQASQQERDLELMRQRYGESHPNVKRARRTLQLYRGLAALAKNENDPRLLSLKTTRLREQAQLDDLQTTYPPGSPAVQKILSELGILDIQIDEAEDQLGRRHRNPRPTPLPSLVVPTTQPFAKDFHLWRSPQRFLCHSVRD